MFSLVVPTYNERENVRPLLERTLAALDALSEPAELLIVDDDSPDGTAEEVRAVAERLGAADRVRLVVRTRARGLARAVAAGFREARGDVLAVMDADLSHPPELLPELLAPIRAGEADIVVASRRVPGGGVENWSLWRRFVSWGAGFLARPLVPVKDTTSGYFAVRRECVEGVDLRPIGYKIGLETLARARYSTAREVPFTFTDRRAGKSKLGGRVCLAYLFHLGTLYRERFPRLVGYLMFSLVGALGILVDASIFNLARWYLGLTRLGAEAGVLVAQTVSFAATASFNFFLNRAWTFRERSARASLGVFMLVCAGGYALRTPVVMGIVRAAGAAGAGSSPVASNLALLAGIFLASFWNFLASRRWAFPKPTAAARPSEVAAPTRRELRARALVLALVIGVGVFRLVFANLIGLASDEAHYWEWSRRLDLGYHDHPPLVAYLIAAGTKFFGVTQLGVRFASIILSTALVWVTYVLGARYAAVSGDRQAAAPEGGLGSGADPGHIQASGLWAAVAMLVIPVLSVGGMIATPDIPMLFFWTATIALTLRALRGRGLVNWIGAGVALGLGMLSKYPMVLLPVALVGALLASRPGRRALRTPGPYVAAGVGVAICVPILIWQIQHGFVSVLFQLRHGLGPAGGAGLAASLKTFGFFVAGQAGAANPVLFVPLMWALWKGAGACLRRSLGAKARASEEAEAMLPILVFPAALTLLVFGLASLRAESGPNWPAAAYPTLCVLLAPHLARWVRGSGAKKALVWSAVGFGAVLLIYVHLEIAFPMVPLGPKPFDRIPDRAPLARWAEATIALKGEEGREAVILAGNYQVASLLAFYLPDHPETDAPFETGSGAQYTLWRPRMKLEPGARAWYFTRSENDDGAARLMEEPELVGRLDDTRLGVVLERYWAYFGRLKAAPGGDPPAGGDDVDHVEGADGGGR